MQNLADDLGLEIIGPQPSARKRFLVRHRALRRFPLSFGEALSVCGKFLLPHNNELETAADFGQTYFGSAFTRQVIGPGLSGIYGAAPERLSFPGALGRVAKILNNNSSLPLALLKSRKDKSQRHSKEKRPIGTHSFVGGMGELCDALAHHLQDHLRLQTDGLNYKDSTESIILTTPAYAAADFFEGKIKSILERVVYLPLISATLFFHRKDLQKFKGRFWLFDPSPGRFAFARGFVQHFHFSRSKQRPGSPQSDVYFKCRNAQRKIVGNAGCGFEK